MAGLAQTEGEGQSLVRVHEPPLGTHSVTPSPQRSTQTYPLPQSLALAQGPNGLHSPSTWSGFTPQTSSSLGQSSLFWHAGPLLQWQIVPAPVTSRHWPKSGQLAEVAHGVYAWMQKGTPSPPESQMYPCGHVSAPGPHAILRLTQLPLSHANPSGQSRESPHPLARPQTPSVQVLPLGQSPEEVHA